MYFNLLHLFCNHFSLDSSSFAQGVSFQDVVVFDEIMDNLSDIDLALGMYYAAGVCITPGNIIDITIIKIIVNVYFNY